MNEFICGIDPSLNSSGVCIFQDGTPYHYECITPYPLKEMERLHSNYLDYCRIFSTYKDIKCIAFEKQVPQMRYHKSAGNIISLAENIGIMKLAIVNTALLYNPDLIVLAIPPADIKSFATGKANADKEMMMNAVNGHHMRYIKKNIPDYSIDDVADAYHIAKFATSLLTNGEYRKYLYEDYRKSCSEEV